MRERFWVADRRPCELVGPPRSTQWLAPPSIPARQGERLDREQTANSVTSCSTCGNSTASSKPECHQRLAD